MGDSTHCSKCGQDIWQMAERGAWVERTSPKGGPFVGQCAPSCEHKHGGSDEALLGALEWPQQQETMGGKGGE